MRATVGDIAAAQGGSDVTHALLEECRMVAAQAGFAPREAVMQRSRGILTEAGSALTASMLRDLENGSAIEADHVIGDMIKRAGVQRGELRVLPIIYAHLKAYELRRRQKALK
jgi:2-dehydropantoate 2-reductase